MEGSCHLLFILCFSSSSLALAAQARQHERVHPQLRHPLQSEGLAKSYHPYTANHLFDQTVLEYKLSLPLTAVFPLHYSITAAPHSCLATFMILYRCVRTTMYILFGVVIVQPQNWGEKHSCNILPGVGHLIVFKETSSHLHTYLHVSLLLSRSFKKLL